MLRKSHFRPAVAFLTLTLGVFLLSGLAKDITWAPQYDQAAQFYVDICNAHPANEFCPVTNYPNHPDFPIDLCSGLNRVDCERAQTSKIEAALSAAFQKGIRLIDIYFYLAEGQPNYDISDLCAADHNCTQYMEARTRNGQMWIDAVERFNAPRTSDYFKVKVRVPAFGKMTELAHNKKDNSFEELQNIPLSIQECSGLHNKHLVDMANPKIRKYIGLFAKQVVKGAQSRLTSGKTKIVEATLALDGAGESCLWGNEDTSATCQTQVPFSSFSNARYPAGQSIQTRSRYFRAREGYLKATYKEFADSVRAVDSAIKPAIFLQTWPMDGRIRGTFDLYDLLKGTGIKVLHHDDYVQDQTEYLSLTHHLEHAAEAATITRVLGMSFDEELSWAHFSRIGVDPKLAWSGANPPDTNNMIPANAKSFYRQVQASFQLGGTGFTYANWAMSSIMYPPAVFDWGLPGMIQPNPDWHKIVGDFPNYSSNHLTEPGGLLTSQLTTELPGASKAIYLSAMGRMECEENQTCGDSHFLWTIFSAFGLESEFNTNKVDVITDGMIRDGIVNLDSYSAIYLPYKTSGVIDSRVYAKLVNRTNNSNVFWQNSAGGLAGFSDWKAGVKRIYVSPVASSFLALLLLN